MEPFNSKFEARAARPSSLTPTRALSLLPQGMVPVAAGTYAENFTTTPTLEEAQWLCRLQGVFVGAALHDELFEVPAQSSAENSLVTRAREVVEGSIPPG